MNWSNKIQSHDWPTHFHIPSPGAAREVWVKPACNLFPGLAESLAATPQDPIHHAEGDVWTHTQMVVDELLALPQYALLSEQERGVVFYAALLHDISKPQTTQRVGGRIVAPGHSAKGAIASRIALWEHEVPFILREQVCRLVETHQVPFFAFDNRRALSAEYTARQLSSDRSVHLLCLLAEADMRGRYCNDQQKVLDDIHLFSHLADELGCLNSAYAFPDSSTRIAYLRSEGKRYADEPVFLEKKFEVIMASGLPASGKSTWVAEQDMPSVSYDDLREELGFKYGKGTGSIIHAADDRMREFLRKQEPFIVNATHLSKQMRRRTLDLVHAYGGQVRIVYFEASKSELLARNTDRDTTLKNEKLISMAQRWEVPGLDEVEELDVHLDWKPRQSLRLRR